MEAFGDLAIALREELLADFGAGGNRQWFSPSQSNSSEGRTRQVNEVSLRHRVKTLAGTLSWQPSISVQRPARPAAAQGDHLHVSSFQLPSLRPMSLARRLGGCVILLLLACVPYLVYMYVTAMLPAMLFAMQDSPLFSCSMVGTGVVLVQCLFFYLVKEAQRSQLGRMLRADVVPVADLVSLNKKHWVLVAPEMEVLAVRENTEHIRFAHSDNEGVSLSSNVEAEGDVAIGLRHEVVRLRLPVRVTLADGHAEERCRTLQHRFYFEGKEQLSIQVRHEHGGMVISRTWAGLPRSFRVVKIMFSVSAYLMLSWLPRIVVLLFFPTWVDPAFSDVYIHRKLLVGERV